MNPAVITSVALAALLLTGCGVTQSASPTESVNDMTKPFSQTSSIESVIEDSAFGGGNLPRPGTVAEGWLDDAVTFWEKQM